MPSTSTLKTPMVSVIMAVKNGGQIMREAVDSILNQTYVNFEFIIINDGSTDETLSVLSEYDDPRIKVYSQENQGLARSLNRGIGLATAKYIARQDHDDISMLTRLEKQVAYLEDHLNVGLLGTAAEIWTETHPTGRFHHHPTKPEKLRFDLIFNNPFVHTSWMFRAQIVNDIGPYTIDPNREPPEDYEYASRIARNYDVANLAEILVIYREFPNSLSSEIRPNQEGKKKTFLERLALISAENIAFWNDCPFSNANAINFGALLHGSTEKFIGRSSFSSLEKMIWRAAKKITKISGGEINKETIRHKIRSLRYQFFISPKVTKFEKCMMLLSVDGAIQFGSMAKRKIYERLTGPGPRREKILRYLKMVFHK